jgi:hypothetical protein
MELLFPHFMIVHINDGINTQRWSFLLIGTCNFVDSNPNTMKTQKQQNFTFNFQNSRFCN